MEKQRLDVPDVLEVPLDLIQPFVEMNDVNISGRMLKAMYRYGFKGVDTDFSDGGEHVQALWEEIKLCLDQQIEGVCDGE